MLIGSGTGHILQIVTATGGANITFEFDVISVSTATPPVVDGSAFLFAPPAANPIVTATTTSAVVGAASMIKRVLRGTVCNTHASATEIVTVQKTDGTETACCYKATLLAGESMIFTGGSWLHYDTNGAIYPSVGNAATQAEMEAGTSTSKYVTPQGVNWHPGVAKFWLRGDTAAGLTANWNVTSLTDTGTGVMGVTIATDFSAATAYCCQVSVEATATTWAVANTRECHIRNATLAIGTVSVDCIDNTATTSLVKDPSSWHVIGFGDQA